MKKASVILFKISTILNAIVGTLILISACAFLIMGFSAHINGMLAEAYDNGTISWPAFFPEMNGEVYALYMQIVLIVLGFEFIALGVVAVIASIVAIRVRKEPTRGLLIGSIILGLFSVETMVVAGILGLIALNKEQLQK